MNKILLYIYISIAAILFTACDKDEHPTGNGLNPNGTFTFNLSLDFPEDDTRGEGGAEGLTRASVKMARYLLEMYEGDLTATPVKMNNATGTFDVTMKKGVDYICLFWADGGDKEYTATDLKAVTQTTPANVGKPAYYGKVTVNTSNFNGTVTLKRAVAEVNFTETTGFTTTDNTLTVQYPITGAAFNVSDGTVSNFGTGADITRTFTGIAATAKDGLLATDYLLAPATQTAMNGIKIKFNQYDEKTLTATPLRANFKTNINGKYDTPFPPANMTFTIDMSAQTDKTYVLPFAETGTTGNYTLTIDWGDGSAATTIPAGTDLSTPAAATLLTHNTYAEQKTYQITITSSQGDGSKPQMPSFSPGIYRTSGNNNLKLSSMDSPMLNMGKLSFREAFKGCTGLKTIHVDLLANNTAVNYFWSCFSGCSSLTSIPEGLFATNTAVTDFRYCFSGCTSITSIPEGLFAKNIAATNFMQCFSACSSLTTIPEGLFANNTAVTNFEGCFANCKALTTIPKGLFAKNIVVTNLGYCFSDCTALTVIPESLFVHNTAVTTFAGCFRWCSSLTAIPEGLFNNNTAATNFKDSFTGCNKLKLNDKIFSTTGDKNRFSGKVMDFTNCFSSVGSYLSDVSDSKAPDLWNYDGAATWTKTSCFLSCKAGNSADIPDDWKSK